MMEPVERPMADPWMRGTHSELDPLRRGVVHALELAGEDAERWAGTLGDEVMFARPQGLPSVAFQLRHTVRSLDRLLTYAEDRWLDDDQIAALASEAAPGTAGEVMEEFRAGIAEAMRRVRAVAPKRYEETRGVGRKRLPTTLGGLLVHCAEHTSRHAGQMVTTAKLVGLVGAERTA